MAAQDVDTICTSDELRNEVGGTNAVTDLLQEGRTEKEIRTRAYEDVLAALRRRTPPILEADLQDPTELREAVAYRAAERLYEEAMTGTDNDVYDKRRKLFNDRADDAINGLMPTLVGDVRGSAASWSVERR